MKGIIFTEFLDLVEKKFGIGMVDKIIAQSELKSAGAYTAVGTYDFGEMLQLMTHLSHNTSLSIDDLLLVYAEHLFHALVKSYQMGINVAILTPYNTGTNGGIKKIDYLP